MTLAVRDYDNRGRPSRRNILTHCPACGHEFLAGESRSEHFADNHVPEDFGL